MTPWVMNHWLIHMCNMTHDADEDGKWRTMSHHRLYESFVCGAWLIHMCDICVIWLIHMWETWLMMRTKMWSDTPWVIIACTSSSYVERLIYTCDMTHSCVRHDPWCERRWESHTMSHSRLLESFVWWTWLTHVWGGTWHIHEWDWLMTSSYQWHESRCGRKWEVTHHEWSSPEWVVCMWGVTHSYVWYDSFICETWLMMQTKMGSDAPWLIITCIELFVRETWLAYVCDMTHSYAWYDSFICVACLMQ